MALPDKGFCSLLTYDDHQSVFSSTLPSVWRDLLVRRHVSHIIHFTLLALVHGLVGLFVSPAETKASPEPSWTRKKTKKKGLCQCLHSDTSVCTLKLAAVQFDLWSIQCLGKHLRSSMSNTSYCIVQLGFYESCLCCRWKQNRVALGQTASLDITLKRLIHIFPWCQGWVHFNFLLLWRGYTYLSEKVARSLIKLWVTHPCLFFTHVLILMVS